MDKIELLDHNKEVYEEMCIQFDEYSTLLVIMASGTGKSYITGKYIQDYNLRALIVTPTIAIKDSWVSLMKNEVDIISYHLFASYTIDKLDQIVLNYDLIVFDEAHHVGADKWGKNIEYLKEKILILGLTADPNRYSDKECASVKKIFDNHLVYGLDIVKAIEQKVLPSFEYISCLYSTSIKISRKRIIDENMFNKLIGSLDMIGNKDKLKDIFKTNLSSDKHRILLFVNCIDSINEARDLMNFIFDGEADIYDIHSGKSQNICASTMKRFLDSESKISILISINKLNEGIHVNDIDTVIMMRKTCSPQIFFQQLSRILSSNNFEKSPKIFDIVQNNLNLKYANDLSIGKMIDNDDEIVKRIRKLSDQIIIKDYSKKDLEILQEILDSLKPWIWSEEEDDIIRKYYTTGGVKEAQKYLPNRTLKAISARAIKLGIASYKNKWSEEEEDIIRKYYPIGGLKEVQKYLPNRTKNNGLKKRMISLENIIQ